MKAIRDACRAQMSLPACRWHRQADARRGRCGLRSEALALEAQLDQVMATQYVRRTWLAMIETCLGNKDAAFEWLEKVAGSLQGRVYRGTSRLKIGSTVCLK